MKLKIFVLLLLITFQGYSQISVSARHIGKSSKFEKGVLEKFKNTETIFLLSGIYDKSEYDKILKTSWNVTPYKIVDSENFDIEDYISDKYSIAQLEYLSELDGLKVKVCILSLPYLHMLI